MKASFRKNIVRLGLALAVIAVFTLPAMATSGAWKWADQSALLPYRDGVSVTLSAARAGDWLTSDGSHLYRFDGTVLTDLTRDLRNRNAQTVSGLYSDGNKWLVYSQSQERSASQLWIYDGASWNDISSQFGQFDNLDAVGQNGVWYVRTFTKATAAEPSKWTLFRFTENSAPVQVTLPNEVAPMAAGCFNYIDSTKLCTGASLPVYANGTWYLIAGTSQARGLGNVVTQQPKAAIWRLDGTTLNQTNILPAASFVSGIWPGQNAALIATSNAVTNPFAADHLYVFDGTSLRDISNGASAHNLFSVDAREIRAASDGKSWLILAGKQLTRFDGVSMTDEGKTLDLFQVVSGDTGGRFVLGGAVSNSLTAFPLTPLTAKLIMVTEDPNVTVNSLPLVSGSVSEILSKIYGPSVSVSGSPADARIGNGKTFTLLASAKDAAGIDHVDIYINGARIKSCPADTCDYTQTYWTNGAASRQVVMFARATNKQGYANDSDKLALTVDTASNATAANVTSADATIFVPVNLAFNRDTASGINYATWLDPKSSVLATGKSVTFGVAAKSDKGLATIDIWVNGAIKKTCAFKGQKDVEACIFKLQGNQYGYGTEIFVNADIHSVNGKNVWTPGTRLMRDTVPAAAATVNTVTPAPVSQAAFTSDLSVNPNVATVSRGAQFNVKNTSLNNTVGILRTDLYLNGAVLRSCSFGAAVSPVTCEATVDTTAYNQGVTLDLASRTISADGHDIWSGEKYVTVSTSAAKDAPVTSSAANGMNVWSWLSPGVSELSEGQTATYSVGAWSPAGLSKIEMIVDGTVRQTCYGGTGSRDCSFTASTSDFYHGHAVSLSARVTDAKGLVLWSEPKLITIKREWTPLNNPGPYANVTTDHASGYVLGERVMVTARGWAPNGMSRLDIYANGAKVATCPTEMCTWTSPALISGSLEYQARLVDNLGRDTWSGLYGIAKK